ncbi:MAG: hypothetical protein Q8K34_02825 [Hydrogenophaga sp.]|nr:hypothetical protein [Hydrogenophaga sp.]
MPAIQRPPAAALTRGAVLLAALLLASLPAMATVAVADKAGAAKRKPGKVSFVQAPSHETPAAREKRLKRECKGRPSAGMCLGHTR